MLKHMCAKLSSNYDGMSFDEDKNNIDFIYFCKIKYWKYKFC